MDDYSNYFAMLQQQANLNNSWSAEQAQKQMDFQERMSNTAHQREVADLKAAGLNPILSARLGGASTPSGAAASADTSIVGAMVELMSQMIDVQKTSASAALAAVDDSSYASDVSGKDVLLSRIPLKDRKNLSNEDRAAVEVADLREVMQNTTSLSKNDIPIVRGSRTGDQIASFINGFKGVENAKGNTASGWYAAGKRANKLLDKVGSYAASKMNESDAWVNAVIGKHSAK